MCIYIIILYYSLNARKKALKRLGAQQKSVSNTFTRFKSVSEEKLQELKKNKLKRRTYAKMMWGVNTYKEWRIYILSNPSTFDVRVFESDLERIDLLNVETFQYAMCKFVAEVTKAKDGSEYPGKTLYHLVISVQKFLNEKGLDWKLVESNAFGQLRNVLDNTMKDRASRNIGTTVRQAQYISLEFENKLWDKGLLGENTPDKLRDTVLFLLGINLGLRAGDEHYDLRRETLEKPSQIQFETDNSGVKCIVYREDSVTKTNDGGLKSMRKQRKIVWVHPSNDKTRDPVRLVEKYISLCPPVSPKTKKFNFYLRSLERPTPTRWYGEQIVGINSIRKVVQNIAKNAESMGFMTNHSLRRSGATRLFQNGIDRKLVKEFTGHVSDAVDQYQVTSDQQRCEMSRVLQGERFIEKEKETCEPDIEVVVNEDSKDKCIGCTCSKKKVDMNQCNQIGEMIKQLVKSHGRRRATIKIEVDFHE